MGFLVLLQAGLSVKDRERNTNLHSMTTNAFQLAFQLFDVVFEVGHFVQSVPSFETARIAAAGIEVGFGWGTSWVAIRKQI